MFAEEWPLMMFTLLTQLAVGSYLFAVIIRSFKNKAGNELSINITKRGIFLVGPVMLLAFICSVFHLGTPFGAYRSIGNLGSSWLSREIIFAGGFFVLWLVTFVLDRKGSWNQIAGWITSLVGLGAVYSMASIYANSIKPAWTDVNTYIAFFGTTIVFGVVASTVLVLLSKEEKSEGLISVLKGIGLVGLGAIVIQLIYLPVYASGLLSGGQAGIESASLLTETYGFVSIIRWVLSIVGIGIIGFALYRKLDTKTKSIAYFAALSLVLVGEFLGRYVFYGTGVSMFIG
jgi:anaerobic dimethyl sulfoxide reductase subunit C (anchor subunit)